MSWEVFFSTTPLGLCLLSLCLMLSLSYRLLKIWAINKTTTVIPNKQTNKRTNQPINHWTNKHLHWRIVLPLTLLLVYWPPNHRKFASILTLNVHVHVDWSIFFSKSDQMSLPVSKQFISISTFCESKLPSYSKRKVPGIRMTEKLCCATADNILF